MKEKRIYILLLILVCLFITACNTKHIKAEKSYHQKTEDKYAFYQVQNKKRYKDFQKEHPELTLKDVIIRVNLNLDQPFYTHTSMSKDLNQKEILVNKYFYLGEDYVPENLVELDKTYSKGGIFLVQEASDAFKRLVDAAKKEKVTIRAISAYRSYSYQVSLYNRYVEQEGSKQADTYSARPGFSEHQTGLCVDVDDRVTSFTDFETTKGFQWMQENAHHYGFILRYPKDKENITGYQYESWHYRYVGKEIAKSIKESGQTFDEYYIEFLMKKSR